MTEANTVPSGAEQRIPRAQVIISVLWPSFITAGIATVLFFTAFDPARLLAGKSYGDISRLGAYSIGFFLFWLLTATSCLLSWFFQRPCAPTPRTRRKP